MARSHLQSWCDILYLNDVDRGFVNQNTKKLNMTKLYFFTRKVFKHISKTLISLISLLQAVKSAIKNTGKKPGPNTEILRTTVRIRIPTDRTSTNQNAGFFNSPIIKVIIYGNWILTWHFQNSSFKPRRFTYSGAWCNFIE